MIRKDIKALFHAGLAKDVGWDPERHPHAHILEAQLQQMLCWVGDIKGKRVLDIGIASGRFVREFSRRGAVTYGVDISPVIIEDVSKYLHGLNLSAELVEGDAEDLPFDDDFFDVVNCQEVLIHLPNQLKGLAEMRRVLKPDGRLVVDITNKFGLYSLHQHYFKSRIIRRLKQTLTGRMDKSIDNVNFRTKAPFLGLLREAGLEIIKLRGFGFLPPIKIIIPNCISRIVGTRLDLVFGSILTGCSSFMMVLSTKNISRKRDEDLP